MLTEIICEKFRKRKIEFHKGLNVIVGDGTNSIGKSALLLVIDFILGGNDFVDKNKDVISHIKHHRYYFSFSFEKPYFFARETNAPRSIYVCNEHYDIIRTICLDEYKNFLKQKYIPSLKNLSFREFIGTFSRIWGKGNDEISLDLKPLQAHSSEGNVDCVYRLIKIFNQYEHLGNILNAKNEKEDRLKAIRKLFNTDFLPHSIKKKQYDENAEEIAKITDEVTSIKQNLATFALSIQDIINDRILKLKEEKDVLLAEKFQLDNKRRCLQRNLTSQRNFKTKGIKELQEIIPNIDENKLAQIEAFHNNILRIISQDIKTSLKQLDGELSQIETRISQIDDEFANKLSSADAPTALIDKVYSLANDYSRCKSENDLYDKEHSLVDEIKKLSKEIDDTVEATLKEISRKLNVTIFDLCRQIYGDAYRPPVFSATPKGCSYSNNDNTGTGAAASNLLVFDIAIMNLTPLPILIHDSRLFNGLESSAIDKILPHYNVNTRQAFVALDDIDKLSDESKKLVGNNKAVELTSSATLYDEIWRETSM